MYQTFLSVWEYSSDSFVHFEPTDDGDMYVTENRRLYAPGSLKEMSLFELPLSQGPTGREAELFPGHSILDGSDAALLDVFTREKIRNLIVKYEDLLMSQLDDQKLYFEKRLARATVEAFEQSSNQQQLEAGTTGGRTLTSDEEMDGIAELKLEISGLEVTYGEVLAEIRESEEALRFDRKEIDRSIVDLKDKKARLESFVAKTSSLKEQSALEQAELEQQLRDLQFYVRTQASVQASPLKDEIQEGGLLVVEGSGKDKSDKTHRSRREKKLG